MKIYISQEYCIHINPKEREREREMYTVVIKGLFVVLLQLSFTNLK
jgi:hypothetical protein